MQRAEPGVHPADGGEEAPASADGASVPCPCLTHPGDDPLREPNISNLSLPLFLVGLPYALVESTSNGSAAKKIKSTTWNSITLPTGSQTPVQRQHFLQTCSGQRWCLHVRGPQAVCTQRCAPTGVAACNMLHSAKTEIMPQSNYLFWYRKTDNRSFSLLIFFMHYSLTVSLEIPRWSANPGRFKLYFCIKIVKYVGDTLWPHVI